MYPTMSFAMLSKIRVLIIVLIFLAPLVGPVYAGDDTIPMPGDRGAAVPMPGDDTVPLPGSEMEPPLSPAPSPVQTSPLEFRGYFENTLNIEYLKGQKKELFLNSGKARVDLFGAPNPSLDFGIGLVGTVNVGASDVDLMQYLPDDVQEQIVPGTEEFFVYHLPENNLYLQEAFGSLYLGHFWLRVGRHKFYTGTGYAYNPIDLFNVKDPLDLSSEANGLDALLFAFDFPRQTELQGLIRVGEDVEHTDYSARLKTYITGWDLAFQYTYYLKQRTDWEGLNSEEALIGFQEGATFDSFVRDFRWQLIGGEFAGELWQWAVYGEGGYVFIDAPDEVGTLQNAGKDHERLLVGIDHTFDMQLYVILEYLRLGQGRTASADITLNDRMALFSGEVLSNNRDTVFTGLSYPLTDLLEGAVYGIIGCNDSSLLINPWLIYDIRPGLKLWLTGNFLFGDKESQNSNLGPSGFLRLKWNF